MVLAYNNLTPLDSTVTVYVPGTINKNESNNNAFHLQSVKIKMSNMFGGTTSTDCDGTYKVQSDDEDCHCCKGDIIEEKVTKVCSNCTYNDLIKYLPEFYDMCNELKTALNQESIGIEINGRMGFI